MEKSSLGKDNREIDTKPQPIPIQKKDAREVPGKVIRKTQGNQEVWEVTDTGYDAPGVPGVFFDAVSITFDEDTGLVSDGDYSVNFCPRGYRVNGPGINDVWCPLASIAFAVAKNKNNVTFTIEDES
jgi:hypothetical protein